MRKMSLQFAPSLPVAGVKTSMTVMITEVSTGRSSLRFVVLIRDYIVRMVLKKACYKKIKEKSEDRPSARLWPSAF